VIPADTIDTIITTARIEEVIGDFVSLRRRGVNLLGLCPFHNEKTPSFTVSPAKGIYKCFGCGKAGNSVNFIMEHEHFTYPEALRYLARKYSIEIEEEERTPEEEQARNEKESLYNLNLFAQQYFTSTLTDSEEGKSVGLSYFRERGMRDDMVKKFQLGYSPSQRDAFSSHALKSGYKKEFLVKTGLSVEKDGKLYDRFHSRVIFPIHSASGRVIGFGGRILGSDKTIAKYVNSPESEIYNKSKTLYGIYFAKNEIISKDVCLLVEGYTDVISMHQAGIGNVVASSGTSLTIDQIRMIQRYTPNISILYDGDPAGIKASFRGIDMILEQGMNVKIVLFPDGEDPDSYARKHHPNEVTAFIAENSVNFILFKTKLLLAETQHDPIKKAALIKEIVNTIALIPDGISRSLYIRECSAVMSITEQVLMNEMNKVLRARIKKGGPGEESKADDIPVEAPIAEPQIEIDLYSSEFQERDLIRLLLLYGKNSIVLKLDENDSALVNVSDYIIHEIHDDDIPITNKVFNEIFQIFNEHIEKNSFPSPDLFLNHPNEEIAKTTVNLVFTNYELSPNWLARQILVDNEEVKLLDAVNNSLLKFKVRWIDKQLDSYLNKIKDYQESGNELESLRFQFMYNELKKKSNEIHSKKLKRVVIR
jgi:DNA primase